MLHARSWWHIYERYENRLDKLFVWIIHGINQIASYKRTRNECILEMYGVCFQGDDWFFVCPWRSTFSCRPCCKSVLTEDINSNIIFSSCGFLVMKLFSLETDDLKIFWVTNTVIFPKQHPHKICLKTSYHVEVLEYIMQPNSPDCNQKNSN